MSYTSSRHTLTHKHGEHSVTVHAAVTVNRQQICAHINIDGVIGMSTSSRSSANAFGHDKHAAVAFVGGTDAGLAMVTFFMSTKIELDVR